MQESLDLCKLRLAQVERFQLGVTLRRVRGAVIMMQHLIQGGELPRVQVGRLELARGG
jgi:hypothetical protein